MAVIGWGRCTIKYATSNGSPQTPWKELATPKEGSTAVNFSEGDKIEAKIEGGITFASRQKSGSYEVEFEHFVDKDYQDAFGDTDGVIAGQWALQIIPEDESAPGVQIDCCTLSRGISYRSDEGVLYKYKVYVQKPTTGNQVKVGSFTGGTFKEVAKVSKAG